MLPLAPDEPVEPDAVLPVLPAVLPADPLVLPVVDPVDEPALPDVELPPVELLELSSLPCTCTL
jgi:hypothetical protein